MTTTPFRKILIANRGEIALRIIKTAQRMGYGTVAVYSEADRDALHVRAADEAYGLGGSLPADSYLRVLSLIDAARASGADAVHPGYGFLAENAAFAAACHAAGLVFIGPSPEAIRAMGDKARAKILMQKAGVPCIPGYQGEDQSDARLTHEAERIGFPVMIKAVAGGGGRGMRLARDANNFGELLHSARSEAQHAFGDQTLLLERALEAPRHIEIQVFGDRYGNAIHLGERDCSVQRRHQKLIEEAPSPAVSPELRGRMGEAAAAAVHAINYEGAGTLEFLLDGTGNFFFMEMNTRLQVEHPVTEFVTGLDLVELQLRIAGGERLPLRQDDVRLRGHAIEVRLCTEDPEQDFLPQSGRIALWRAAAGVRTDSALESGANIPPFYDSMVAKIIAHGASRDEARRKLIRGLEETIALGIKTNREFLLHCLKHPTFAEGRATTNFVETHRSAVLEASEKPHLPDEALAAAALYLTEYPEAFRRGRSLASDFMRPMRFICGGRTVTANLRQLRSGGFEITFDGHVAHLEVDEVTAEAIDFRARHMRERAIYARSGRDLFLACPGRTLSLQDRSYDPVLQGDVLSSDGRLRAAMSGRVVAIFVKQGDRVESGQPIVTLEAMKMEHVHTAPIAGIVKTIHVDQNEQVAMNKIVAEIEGSSSH